MLLLDISFLSTWLFVAQNISKIYMDFAKFCSLLTSLKIHLCLLCDVMAQS